MAEGNDSKGLRGCLENMRYAFESMKKAMDCALEVFDGMAEAPKTKGGKHDHDDIKEWPFGWKYADDAPFIKPFDWHMFDWTPRVGDAPYYEMEWPRR